MMIKLLMILPILACIALFYFRSKMLNRITLYLYPLLLLATTVSFYLVPQQATEGKEFFSTYFSFDNLNILFFSVLSIIFAGVSIYGNAYLNTIKINKHYHTYYSIATILFVFSMTGTILSTHLGLSWVFIEATTLTSAYFVYFNKTKHSLEAAWKYVFICSIGISLAFVGIILLSIGTQNIHSMFFENLYAGALKITPLWLKLSFAFMLIGFGTKMGLAPVHAWLPDAHSEAPAPASALLSGTLLNSAFFIILKLYKLMNLAGLEHYAKILLFVMGFISVFVTAVFVLNSKYYKRMLAYSSIENMGIIIIGIALGGTGVYAAILHMIGHSLVKSSFFLTSGNILNIYKTKKISNIKRIFEKDRLTSWLWIFCFIAISGFPPFSLFISEFMIVKEMISQNHTLLTIIFLLLLTIIIYGIAKSVIKMSFTGSNNNKNITVQEKNIFISMYIPQIVFLIMSILLGIYIPEFINKMIHSAVVSTSLI